MSRNAVIKHWYVLFEGNKVALGCKGYVSNFRFPAFNKNGNGFDRFWLIRAARELREKINTPYSGMLGNRTPTGISYSIMTPTTGGISFFRREHKNNEDFSTTTSRTTTITFEDLNY